MGQKRESPSTVEMIKQPLRWPFRRNSYHNWTCLRSCWGDEKGPEAETQAQGRMCRASAWTAASSQKRKALWEMGSLAKGWLQRRMRLREKRFCNNIRSFFLIHEPTHNPVQKMWLFRLPVLHGLCGQYFQITFAPILMELFCAEFAYPPQLLGFFPTVWKHACQVKRWLYNSRFALITPNRHYYIFTCHWLSVHKYTDKDIHLPKGTKYHCCTFCYNF